MPRSSAWLARGAVVLCTLLIGLGILEISARLYFSRQQVNPVTQLNDIIRSDRLPKGIFLPRDSNLGVRLTPNREGRALTSDFSVEYKINELGMRDAPANLKKPSGVTRYLAIGDSLTFGEGIPYGERYVDILEKGLPHTEVWPMAVPGHGLDEGLAWYANEGERFQADAVLLFVTTANLKRENLSPNRKIPPAHYLTPAQLGSFQSFWIRYSYVASYLRYLYLIRPQGFLESKDAREWLAMSPKDGPPPRAFQDPARERRIAGLLQKLQAVCTARKTKLIVVNTDARFHFPFLEKLLPTGGYLDFSEDLAAMGRIEPLRFKYDPHFNPRAHALIGNKLVSALKK